jgi:single-strand DNA-binding protein
MRTVNKVILIWNITRDPLVKNTENNKKVALFSLATNRYYKTAEWENKSESEFHNCVAWGSLAERAEKFLTKWKLVYVEWRLRTRVIDREDWTKSYKTEIVISSLIFLNKKSDFDWAEAIDELDEIALELDDKF